MMPARARHGAPTVLLVVLVAGCGNLVPSQGTGGLPEYGASPAASQPPPSPKAVDAATVDAASADAGTLVKSISLKTGDVRSRGRHVELESDGDAVDDAHATLSGVCGKALRSDAHRVARRRVQVLAKGDSAGNLVRSSSDTIAGEVVVYESATWAAGALAEWRDAIERCELGRDIDVFGVPVRYYSAAQHSDGRLPVPDNCVTTSVTGAGSTGVKASAYEVIQRRGRVLTTVVLAAGAKAPAAEKAEVLRLAKIIGRRQAKLPA